MSLNFFLTGKLALEDFRNQYPQYTDWRLPENRLEAFTRVFDVRMKEGELDHHHVGKVAAEYMNLTNEQKAWYCLLFGFSYRNHWSIITLQKFPEIWKESRKNIEEWYNDTLFNGNNGAWRRVKFGKDCKWQVRFFPDFIESVQSWLCGESLYQRLGDVSSVGNKDKNFDLLNQNITSLKNMGRMTSWLAIQTIYEFFNFDIDKHDLQLTNGGCWSQFDAMNYLFNVDLKQDKDTAKIHDKNTKILMDYVQNRLPYHVDIYNIESCLCEFRKHWQQNKKQKEFLGWTGSELIHQFNELHDNWEHENIDWTGYLLGFMTMGQKLCGNFGYDEEYFKVGVKTGLNLNTHHYYSDEPDAYELIDIKRPEDCSQPALYLKMSNEIKTNFKDYQLYVDKFNPEKMLRVK